MIILFFCKLAELKNEMDPNEYIRAEAFSGSFQDALDYGNAHTRRGEVFLNAVEI